MYNAISFDSVDQKGSIYVAPFTDAELYEFDDEFEFYQPAQGCETEYMSTFKTCAPFCDAGIIHQHDDGSFTIIDF